MDVEVRIVDSFKGKGLFSKKNITAGSVIFEEDPLVSCQFSWNAAYKYKACDHCMKPLETAEENARRLSGQELILPYPECCTTDKSKVVSCPSCDKEYCSEECKTDAFNQYHQTLCIHAVEGSNKHPLEQLNEAWKHCHYPPETNTVMLIVRLLARIIQADDKDTAIHSILQFCHRTINEDADLAHKLLGEKYANQISLLFDLLLGALPHDGIEQFLTPTGFQSLLAIIGTNGQGVGTSPISQWVSNTSNLLLSQEDRQVLDAFIDQLYDQMDECVGSFLNNEGVALYTLQSSCNHSCVPNAQVSFRFNNHRLSLVATRDIAKGEEIVISYLDECTLNRTRHTRRKVLMRNYLFMCECPKCKEQADEPDLTSEDDEDDEDDGKDEDSAEDMNA